MDKYAQLASLFSPSASTGDTRLDELFGLRPITDEERAGWKRAKEEELANLLGEEQRVEPSLGRQTTTANKNLPHEARALLDTIAGREAPDYNTLYGGKKIEDLSWHPGIDVPIATGPNAGKTSSAFGRYQFLKPTWEKQAAKLGLRDMSPESQDVAAWDLAHSTYAEKTGRDLLGDLRSNDPKVHRLITSSLSPVWTSLPGGAEQGQNHFTYVNAYQRALAQETGQEPLQAGAGSPAEQLLPGAPQEDQIDLEKFEPIKLSNDQTAYMEKGRTLAEAADKLKEMGIDAVPMKQFALPGEIPVFAPYNKTDEEILAKLRKEHPDRLKEAGLPTDTSAWGAYKQQLTSALGQLGVAGGIGLEEMGAEQAGKYLQEKGRAAEEAAKGMFTPPTEEEAGPITRHVGIPLAQGLAGVTAVAPALTVGGVPGLAAAGTMAGAQFYGSQEQQAREAGKEFERAKAVAPSLAVGAVNAVADKFLLPFFKIASSEAGIASGQAIRNLVSTEGEEVAKKQLGSYVGDMLQKAGMAEASGASADIATHLIEKSYQDKPIGTEDTWNEIKDILAQGAPTYLTLGALGGAGEQYAKRTEFQLAKEQKAAESVLSEQQKKAEARLAERQEEYVPTVFDEERPVSYEDLDLKGQGSSTARKSLKSLDIENSEHHTAINQALDIIEEDPKMQHNPAAMQAIRNKIQEVQDAEFISQTGETDGRSSAQSEIREEGQGAAISGEGIQQGGQRIEALEVPQAEEVTPESLLEARAKLREHGLAKPMEAPTIGGKVAQAFRNLFSEGRDFKLRAEFVDKSAPLRNIDKELPSMVGGKLHPAMQAGHLAQATNIISRSAAEGPVSMSANGITEVMPNADAAPIQVYKRAAEVGRAKEVAEAQVAMRYFDFERQADAKQSAANEHFKEAEAYRAQAEQAETPKAAQELRVKANKAETEGNKLARQVEPLRAKQRTIITPEQAKRAKFVYDNDPEVKRAVDGIRSYNQNLLKYWKDSNVITEKQYKDYAENEHYFPFLKDSDFEAMLQDPYTHLQAAFSQMGSAGKSIPAVKQQKYQAHEIFAEKNVLKNGAYIINSGMQNMHRLNALDLMEAYGSAEYVDPKFKSDKDVVQVRRKGVPEYYRVKDPDMFAALNVAGPSLSPFFKTWGRATSAISSGMLLTPQYIVGQPMRESLTATMVGRSAAVTPLDAVKELGKILSGKSETYEKMKNKGILSSPNVITDPAAFIKEVGDQPEITKIGKNIRHLYEMLDGAVRDVLYDKAYANEIKRGRTPEEADNMASALARDVTNFSLQGRNQTIRNLKATTPFYNAALQSLDVLARAAFPRTLGKLSKGEAMEARRLFYSRVAFLAAYSTAYAVMMSDNEDYLKSKDRPLKLLFPNPAGDEDHPLMSVSGVPYEAGFFAKVMPETLTLWNMGKISGKEAAKEIGKGAYDLLVSGVVPMVYLIQPMIENAVNRSFHFGTPIESEPELSEKFRNKRASELTKEIYGKLDDMGVKIPLLESPDKMENAFRSYGTQFWTMTKSMADAYLANRASGPVPPEKSWMDQPYMKGFFPSPKRTTETDEFYEIKEKSRQIMNDLHKAESIHNEDMYNEIRKNPEAEKLFNANPVLMEDGKKLSEIDAKIEEVTKSKDPELTAKRKSEIIKDWEHQKQAIYSRAVSEMRNAGIIE